MFLKTGASPLVHLLHKEIFDFFAVVITPVIHIKEFETFLRNCIDSWKDVWWYRTWRWREV